MIETILPQRHHYTDSLVSEIDYTPSMPSVGEGKMLFHFEPSDNDVICSQDDQIRNHSGNLAFQENIDENVPHYIAERSQLSKAVIVSNIVETIQKRSPNGGFVERVGGQWYEIGAWNARERVLQALEDSSEKLKHSETDEN